jgi:hypothetical protein
MVQLKVARAPGLARKRLIAAPRPAQIATDARQNEASTPAITGMIRLHVTSTDLGMRRSIGSGLEFLDGAGLGRE